MLMYVESRTNTHYRVALKKQRKLLCECVVAFYENRVSITTWYTYPDNRHKGIGYKTMQYCFKRLIENGEIIIDDIIHLPDSKEELEICYVWDMQNEYIHKWLAHFDPTYILNGDNVKIYKLDKNKFLEYLGIS